ncbi:hypothetical protein [Polyangium aurulentum]|uniref:hypothetical protein n=1 Tax=Polyangium aurulentum TaxID=2567896 RepID=UPI00146AC5C0|nr:hypothetical protein [Polyangium aurulentum]UQA61821.1 hypothetical protein E8A73_015645 [Polyangium aurulentum]
MPPPTCGEFHPNCIDEFDAFETCVASAPCATDDQCTGDFESCNCKIDCSGKHLEADCHFDDDGKSTCTCSFDGQVVGTCTSAVRKCGNLTGCCAAVFAESH